MKVIIGVLLAAVLILTSCSFNLVTGGTVASDACSDLQGQPKITVILKSLNAVKSGIPKSVIPA